jgi:hypothetical protein
VVIAADPYGCNLGFQTGIITLNAFIYIKNEAELTSFTLRYLMLMLSLLIKTIQRFLLRLRYFMFTLRYVMLMLSLLIKTI